MCVCYVKYSKFLFYLAINPENFEIFLNTWKQVGYFFQILVAHAVLYQVVDDCTKCEALPQLSLTKTGVEEVSE